MEKGHHAMPPPTSPQPPLRTPSAVTLLLQASPWTPLNVRRGSAAEVTLEVALGCKDRDGLDARKAGDVPEVLVWQFALAEFDIGFQLTRNGVAVADGVRYKAEETSPKPIDQDSNGAVGGEFNVVDPFEGKLELLAAGDSIALQWDNSYSLVRHKQVLYRFLFTSRQALAAAENAALEMQKRVEYETANDGNTLSKPRSPFYIKDLAKVRAMPPIELESVHTEMVVRLEECVMDMVSIFMTNPNCPLHEGAARGFVLALEAVLLDGIKESFVISWPEAPYYTFLTNIETVLRDDKGIVATAKMLSLPAKLQCIGWNRSRALVHIALNEGIFHRAFENLTKRRQLVEKYYESSAILYHYPTAATIASFLSALNAVQFHLEPFPVDDDVGQLEFGRRFPPNLEQASSDERLMETEVTFVDGVKGDASVVRGITVQPNEITEIECCSIPRYCLCSLQMQDVIIGRGSVETLQPIHAPPVGFALVGQIRVLAQDVLFRVSDADRGVDLIEPLRVTASDAWVEITLRITQSDQSSCRVQVKMDNSYSKVRTKQVELRCTIISLHEYEDAWLDCLEMAQSISWKHASSVGQRRCKAYMESQYVRDTDAVILQRAQSGTASEDDESLSMMGFRNSLIANPVSRLVGGFLASDANSPSACDQCLTPFSFFSRQHICSRCRKTVCAPCSRHYVQERGHATQIRVCDRCFLKEKDQERARLGLAQNQQGSGKELAAFTALRADPTMEKYFKMLSVGVPPSAVAQKMAQDEVLPDKLAVFTAGPDGSGGTTSCSSHLRKSRQQHRFQRRDSTFRKVYWTNLESKKADETIWGRVTSRRRAAPIKLSPNDFHELEDLFGVKSMGTKPEGGEVRSKKNVIRSALDPRRSNNVSIGLSQFKSAGGAEAILRALECSDLEFLTLDRLETLLEIAPTAVETKRYTNFRGSRSRLEPAELFLVQMCEIPRVTEKIATFSLAAQFQQQRNELQGRIAKISQACWEILESERLARCFELVLTIGNLLNAGSELEDAHGITLPSLLKLSETKSIDRSMTLLQFIVKLVQDRGEGDVLLFVNDLSSLTEAKRYSNLACASHLRTLQHEIGNLQTEIKEDMANDRARFDREEYQRKRAFEQRQQHVQMPPVPMPPGSHAPFSSIPQHALLAAIRQRNGEPDSSKPKNSTSTDISQTPNGKSDTATANSSARMAMLAGIKQRSPFGQPLHITKSGPPQQDLEIPIHYNLAQASTNATESTPESGRASLLAAIKQRGDRNGCGAGPTILLNENSAKDTTENPIHVKSKDKPSSGRASLLAAIKQREGSVSVKSLGPNTDNVTNVSGRTGISSEKYVPREYNIRSAYIPVMRNILMGMKSDIEDLELEMENLQSLWEATARYVGEEISGTSSEYVFSLLHRFVLDVKVAKSLLFRKGMRFSTENGALHLLPDAQVGSKVLTQFGCGIVTAMRLADHRLEVSFRWSREAYLSPGVVLAAGALVRCRQFGVGIIRSTRYIDGFCSVRFAFGIGVVCVDDLVPETASDAQQLRATLLASPVFMGDPVITPFGCGHVLGIRRVSLQPTRQQFFCNGPTRDRRCMIERIVAVELMIMPDSGEQHEQTSTTQAVLGVDGARDKRDRGGIAYVPESRVRLNY